MPSTLDHYFVLHRQKPDLTESFLCLQNLAAWGTAGFLAYYIWVVPERKVIQEQKVP